MGVNYEDMTRAQLIALALIGHNQTRRAVALVHEFAFSNGLELSGDFAARADELESNAYELRALLYLNHDFDDSRLWVPILRDIL